jgi:polar amino acid transport system substrate-binding protein
MVSLDVEGEGYIFFTRTVFRMFGQSDLACKSSRLGRFAYYCASVLYDLVMSAIAHRMVSQSRGLLCAIAVGCVLGGQALAGEPLRLVTADYLGPSRERSAGNVPGFPREILTRVFAEMGQEVAFEASPPNRSWMMILRGERDGILAVLRSSDRERNCLFPDEPLDQEKWVLYVRSADVGRLKFSSNNDLVGHLVAIRKSVPPGSFEHPELSPELWDFLREHHNIVETESTTESLRMLAGNRVDYAVLNLVLGNENRVDLGLSKEITPLLSRSVVEKGIYTCFSRARVSPSLVDAFSRALKRFKQTESFQDLLRKYGSAP